MNEFISQESPEGDSIVIFALDGHVTSASSCFLAMFGYTDRDAHEGRIDWDALTPPEYWAIDDHCLGKLREGVVPTPFVKEMLHKNGLRIAVRVFAEPRAGIPGEVVARVDLIENHSLLMGRSLRCLPVLIDVPSGKQYYLGYSDLGFEHRPTFE